jgi:hypothetical protein
MSRSHKRQEAESAAESYPGLYVSHQAIDGAYLSLRDALEKAKPGDHIIIRDELIEEHIDLKRRKGITIEGERGRNVIWRSPRNARASVPILSVERVEDVRITGLTLDGQGRVDMLLRMTGRCPGLTLDHLTLTDAKECAVSIASCSGSESRPVSLSDLKVTASQTLEAGIVLEVSPTATETQVNDHLTVQDCWFEGDIRARFRLDDPAGMGKNNVFRRNRSRPNPTGRISGVPPPL